MAVRQPLDSGKAIKTISESVFRPWGLHMWFQSEHGGDCVRLACCRLYRAKCDTRILRVSYGAGRLCRLKQKGRTTVCPSF
jgi:hypothetical protein